MAWACCSVRFPIQHGRQSRWRNGARARGGARPVGAAAGPARPDAVPARDPAAADDRTPPRGARVDPGRAEGRTGAGERRGADRAGLATGPARVALAAPIERSAPGWSALRAAVAPPPAGRGSGSRASAVRGSAGRASAVRGSALRAAVAPTPARRAPVAVPERRTGGVRGVGPGPRAGAARPRRRRGRSAAR